MGALVSRKGRLKPLVLQRQRLAESLVRVLVQLGLERRKKPVTELHEYVAQRYREAGKADGGAGVTEQSVPGAGELSRSMQELLDEPGE